jgi:hypothetical protein
MKKIVADAGNKFLLSEIKTAYDELLEEEKISKKKALKNSDFMMMLSSKMGPMIDTRKMPSGKTKAVPGFFMGWNFQSEIDYRESFLK